MRLSTTLVAALGIFVLGVLTGLWTGYNLYTPEQVVETYAPAKVLFDDIQVLERKPMPPPVKLEKAAKKLGGKLERAAKVTLRPKPVINAPQGCSCEDIEVDLGLVDTGAGKRIVAYTDDATIISGVDTPLAPYKAAHEDKWDVGILVPIDNPEGLGPAVARHIGPFKVGVAAARGREEGWTGYVTASLSF